MARKRGAGARSVGYAVVGLGHIAQVAVLPAFVHARESSRLAAVVSGDSKKRKGIRTETGLGGGAIWDLGPYC